MRLTERVLMGASALVLAGAGLTSAGNAATAGVTIYGAGASLPAPYMRQAMDCYGLKQHLYFQQTLKTNVPPPVDVLAFQYNGSQCTAYKTVKNVPLLAPAAADATQALRYESAGSGNGIKSIFSNDLAGILGAFGANWASTAKVSFALSETALDANDVAIYNNGNPAAYTDGTCGANATNSGHVGLCIAAPGATPGANQYANPGDTHGKLIQLPVLIVPVTIAFDPIYKKVRQSDGTVKSYSLNIHWTRSVTNPDGSTATVKALHLDRTAYCKIFNGQIKNWNDASLVTLNNGVSFQDPADTAKTWSAPFQIVGRYDSSGTSTLFTRHMAKVCPGVKYTGVTNQFTSVGGTLPSALQGPHYLKGTGSNAAPAGETAGKFTLADGSDGVAEYLAFSRLPGSTAGNSLTQSRIGYISPDYALPASLFTKSTSATLLSATLQNVNGQWVAPTANSAKVAFTALPPQSNSDGTYNAAGTGDRSHPDQWVEAPATTSYLADPVAVGSYPIVGTDNMLMYSCYSAGQYTTLKGFLKWYESSAMVNGGTGLLARAGMTALPPAWRTAIQQTFLSPVAATSDLRLAISATCVVP